MELSLLVLAPFLVTIKHMFDLRAKKLGWMQIPSVEVALAMSQDAYDIIVIDVEHGAFTSAQIGVIASTIKGNGVLCFARVALPRGDHCRFVLDQGVDGLIIPQLAFASELSAIVCDVNLPPFGNRGIGFSYGNRYGADFKEFLDNARPPIIVMVERKELIVELSEVFKCDQVIGILIGPYDLSASVGVCGDFQSRIYLDNLDRIKDCSRLARVPIGIHHVYPFEPIQDDSFDFYAYGMDTTILRTSLSQREQI